MALYIGPALTDGDVSLAAVELDEVRATSCDADVAGSKDHWPREAADSDDVLYFGVHFLDNLVGQFFLHDIDLERGEALLGYHLFQVRFRGRGLGTIALRLLQRYVTEQTALRRLVVITGTDNVASMRMCVRCGFAEIGSSREDPQHTVVYEWRVRARARRA
jgi:RimJ/RimL family protein N-acetyltransferase